MNCWHWMILATVLAILEMFTGTLALLLLGVAALINGCLFYFYPHLSWEIQTLGFGALGTLHCLIWFFCIKDTLKHPSHLTKVPPLNAKMNQYLGLIVTLTEPIVNGHGRIQLGDAYWQVKSDADQPAGTTVKLVHTEAMAFKVEVYQN